MTAAGRARRVALAVAALLLLPGCTSFAQTVADTGAAASPAPGRQPLSCPAERARPDRHRPVISYDFRLGDDLHTVTGTETVRFTPDRATDELVFRLVPNAPDSAQAGNRLTVDAVRGDDVGEGHYTGDRAADPGGLYEVPLTSKLAAGDTTEVELDFTLTLGRGTFDRVGTTDGASWWASGAPLLAWEPGVGWARDPFVDVLGETATSPAADTTVTVSAPQDLTVLMTGDQAPPSEPRDGRRTWTSAEPAARDVSVAAGRFDTREATTPDGVRVTVGVLPGGDLDLGQLADWTTGAITDLEQHLGPFPYRTLTVPLLPDYGGGIEYPSSILLAAPDRGVLVHEVAHMWFYGMVGDDQYRDPWLDEAFATWAEAVVDDAGPDEFGNVLQADGDVDTAIGDFSSSDQYFQIVYGKGGAALLEARRQAGADAFDAAIRCYVNANAWTIATPDDVAAALADQPAALLVLLRAGAIRKDDLSR